MEDKLSISWATEVDAFQLGARLEAYVETKPAIEAFRLLNLKLPQEVTDMITNEVKDVAYVENIRPWLEARSCYKWRCRPESHFTTQELHDRFNIGCKVTEAFEEEFEDNLYEESDRRHKKGIHTLLNKFMPILHLNQTDDFGVSRQILAADFGIQTYFTVLKRFGNERYGDGFVELESAKVSAFLTLPLGEAPLRAQSGRNESRFLVEHDLSSVDNQNSSLAEERIRGAIKALRLDFRLLPSASRQERALCECEPWSENETDSDDIGESLGSGNTDNDKSENHREDVDDQSDSSESDSVTDQSVSEDQSDNELGDTSDGSDEGDEGGQEDEEDEGDGEDGEDEVIQAKYQAKRFCFSCGSVGCQGMIGKIKHPALMFLGSSSLNTRNEDYYCW